MCSSELWINRKTHYLNDWPGRCACWHGRGFYQIESTVRKEMCKCITFWKWIYAYLHGEHERAAHESEEYREFEQGFALVIQSQKHRKPEKQDMKESVKWFTHLLLRRSSLDLHYSYKDEEPAKPDPYLSSQSHLACRVGRQMKWWLVNTFPRRRRVEIS